jgi:septum site-determining protein MinC
MDTAKHRKSNGRSKKNHSWKVKVKTKQRNLRIFEIECEDIALVRTYLTKNKALMDGLMVLLKGSKANECAVLCEEDELCYAIAGKCDCDKQSAPKKTIKATASLEEEKVVEIVEKIVIQTVYVDRHAEVIEPKSDKVIKHTTVRSGEDIVTNGDVAIFGRVNSGAKIKAEGSVEVFDTIDGLIECAGDYMLLRSIGKGTVMFAGNKLDAKSFDGKIKKITLNEGVPEIKDL